ncbi:beta-1,4-N-acetylgalactosaminyltransferase 3 [Xenopus laevis]|uniref:Beta-1,4-N-acetylgalactosaminyltransferase n=2 Tax=Xenopus laevis TaxID=8355 RepID=A0A974HQ52_XENLA|nr:beta-1,4-N-acetylgalactosaminyltransferase 3 [Xenopus laevis]OCT86195.1 hypothetical protein XELAEV_18019889mg [Xenopus laevis]
MRGRPLPLKMLNKHMWLIVVGLILILGFFMVFLQLSTSSDGNPMNRRYSSWSELGKALAHKNIPALHPNLEFYKPPKSHPEFMGQANLHVFEDWCGSSIQQLRRNLHFPLYPHVRTTVSKLAVTPQWTNYGLRIFGYLQPATEGEYQFAVSSDDNAEFWLSKDHTVEKLSLMCRVGPTGKQWTAPGEFGKFQDQVSITVRLSPTVKYYFELLHKQDNAGTDHVEVAWRLTELTSPFMVIDSRFLSLFSNDTGDSLGDTTQIPVSAASFHSEGLEQHPADMLKPDKRDHFYKVPLMTKNRIRNVLPTCSYKPSYLVEGYPLQRYQGLQFVHLTYVYPNDYTRLTHMEKDNQCIYQENMRRSNRFTYKRYMKMDQPEQKPNIQPGMFEDYNPSDFQYEEAQESENRGDVPRKNSLRQQRKLLSLISKREPGISERSRAGPHRRTESRHPQNWTESSVNIAVSVSDVQNKMAFNVQDKIIPDVDNASPTLTFSSQVHSQPDTRNSSQVRRPRAAQERHRDRRKQPGRRRLKDNKSNLGESAVGKAKMPQFTESTAKAITQNKIGNEQDQIYRNKQITQTTMPNKLKVELKTKYSWSYEPKQEWTKQPKVEMYEYRRGERAESRTEAKLDNARNLELNLNDGKIQNIATYKTGNPVPQPEKEEMQKPEPISVLQLGRFDPRVNRPDLQLQRVEEQNNEIAIPLPQQEEGQKPEFIDISRLGRFDPRVKRPDLEQVEEQKNIVDIPSDAVRPVNAQYDDDDDPQEEEEEEEDEEEDMEYPLIYEQSVNWNQTFDFGQTDFQIIRPDSIDLQCNTSGNLLLREREVVGVVAAFMRKLNQKFRGMYHLLNIINVEKRRDYLHGSRYFLELELKDRYGHIQRFAHYVYAPKWQGIFSLDDEQERAMKNMMWGSYRRLLGANFEPDLCWPSGLNWNPQATVHFIVPIKNQARWVQKFIRDMETLYLATLDSRFNVIIVDFNSTDFDVEAALRQSHVPSYQYVKLQGSFERSAGLQAGIDLVKNPHSILFLCDLHMHFPPSIIDSMRTHCVEGKMVFAPMVIRLDCGATPRWPEGYWEVNGFGLLGIYKSDLDHIGGMNTQEFKERWGGEDWELLDRIIQAGLEVERVAMRNFYHHYHSKRGMWNRRQAPNWR